MAIPNAQAFVKRVVDTLLAQEEIRIGEILQGILRTNAELWPETPHHGFTYNGGFYDLANLGRGARTRVPLHGDLWQRMDEFVRVKDQIAADRRLISQMMAPLLLPCSSSQDVRDALPECLVTELNKDHGEFDGKVRTRPEGYTLANNPRLMDQFEKLKERIHFYMALRLMF